MTDKQTLEKAISLAIDGGWRGPWLGTFKSVNADVITGEIRAYFQYKDLPVFSWSVPSLIFNHDFAKALWGELDMHDDDDKIPEDLDYYYNSGNKTEKVWEARLQQMVIAEDPIKYLGKNL